MTHRSRLALVALALAAWWIAGRLRASSPTSAEIAAVAPAPHGSSSSPGSPARSGAVPRSRAAQIPVLAGDASGEVTITGRVFDTAQQQPVGKVEVVFRSIVGETSTTTRDDGAYSIRVPGGMYRAFVRDDTVLSVGRPEIVRLPGQPSADAAGVPDEALMTMVLATADTDGVDLSVVRGGILAGHVVDRSGRPIAGAVVRARGAGVRPALATDLAETDRDGSFELRLPAGTFALDASHPRFAGLADMAAARLVIQPGDHLQRELALTAGCVISGRVIGSDGASTGDGAIERQWGTGDLEFAPAGRIEPDGTFRWVTTDAVEVAIRAWPWKSPPSPARRFSCRDGARFDDVVFQLPSRSPDLSGVLVDSAGAPVGSTYVDVQPLDPGGLGQQERTDPAGRWEVYNLPPGHYRLIAQAEGRGVTTQTVVSPQTGVRLALGGTGRLEGTANLAGGSFELVLGTCIDGTTMISLPQTRRLVSITGGRFAVDDLPACELSFSAMLHGRPIAEHVAIPRGGTAHVALDLAPPHAHTVHGVVRDTAGRPVAGASITVGAPDGGDPTAADAAVTSDAAGKYAVSAVAGATLHAAVGGRVGFAQIGGASADEPIDVVVEDAEDVEVED
jgi:protocatechuate 3,4-dioxygenase beta subunit